MSQRDIQPNEVQKQLESDQNLSIIDVRENEEVTEGKIPGAKHIPLGEIHERLDEIDENTEHIMVCRSGGRSGKATDFLMTKGYKVKNMPGGMLDWEGPIEKK